MGLAVCATPIGNLEDVTLRVLRELREADLVLCEDTRHTRRLLERHGIKSRLRSYHEHNEAQRTAEVLPRLEAGERVALVSDAGLPGISDPGGRLVTAALAAGVPVTVLPGPSAVETALVASGFGTDRFQFLGYLPRGAGERQALWAELARWPDAVVA
ncbi:MAG TPA: ribosomal RNA small subunit methyltransferase I, partial [Gaiellaceae bacterium]|nr:ribosomal RNA small subunit methyltransferase I [Gaiellaceae bacterium]